MAIGQRKTGTAIASATGLTGLDATSTFSIALWWKLWAIPSSNVDIFTHRNNTTGADGYLLSWFATNGLRLRVWNGSSATSYDLSTAGHGIAGSGIWVPLAVSLDATSVRFYMWGRQIGRVAQTANATIAGTRATLVGQGDVSSAVPQQQYDLRVWNNYAISPAEAMYVAKGNVLGNESARWFVGNSGPIDLTANGNLLSLTTPASVQPDPDIRAFAGPVKRSAVGGVAGGFVPPDWAHSALMQNLLAQ